MELKPVEEFIHTLPRMFLVPRRCCVGSTAGAMLGPFERHPNNLVFAFNIFPTFVLPLLKECWTNVETV